ncbi:hypothetical protein K2X40_04780 [Candidatus Babeliales bacterium]|nr:hypothetical protein [Candidatus Babeliales bacterium]
MIKYFVLLFFLILPTKAHLASGSPSKLESSIPRLSGAQLDAKRYLTKFISENLLLSNKDTQNTITRFVLNSYKNMPILQHDTPIIIQYQKLVKDLGQAYTSLSEKTINEIFLGLMGYITTSLAEQLKLPRAELNDDYIECDSEFYE